MLKLFQHDSGLKLFHSTVGPFDALYLPSGYLFHELTGNGTIFQSIRWPVLASAHAAELSSIARRLTSVGIGTDILEQMTDIASTAE